jgi:hypothetical protein
MSLAQTTLQHQSQKRRCPGVFPGRYGRIIADERPNLSNDIARCCARYVNCKLLEEPKAGRGVWDTRVSTRIIDTRRKMRDFMRLKLCQESIFVLFNRCTSDAQLIKLLLNSFSFTLVQRVVLFEVVFIEATRSVAHVGSVVGRRRKRCYFDRKFGKDRPAAS